MKDLQFSFKFMVCQLDASFQESILRIFAAASMYVSIATPAPAVLRKVIILSPLSTGWSPFCAVSFVS